MNFREKGKARILFGALMIVAVFISGCSSGSDGGNSLASQINREMVPQPSDLETLVAPVELENTDQISKENFDKIKKGMTFLEVELIILGKSTLISEDMENGEMIQTYRWETADSVKYIEVKFIDEKMFAKSQKGLK